MVVTQLPGLLVTRHHSDVEHPGVVASSCPAPRSGDSHGNHGQGQSEAVADGGRRSCGQLVVVGDEVGGGGLVAGGEAVGDALPFARQGAGAGMAGRGGEGVGGEAMVGGVGQGGLVIAPQGPVVKSVGGGEGVEAARCVGDADLKVALECFLRDPARRSVAVVGDAGDEGQGGGDRGDSGGVDLGAGRVEGGVESVAVGADIAELVAGLPARFCQLVSDGGTSLSNRIRCSGSVGDGSKS